MATVRERNGKLFLDYYDEAGKRHRKALHLDKNRENMSKAKFEKKKLEYELEAGIHTERKPVKRAKNKTILDGLEEFLKSKERKKQSTKLCYKLAVDKFVSIMGNMQLKRIDTEAVREFENKLADDITRFNKPISSNSIASYFNQLKVMFRYFENLRYVNENPFYHKEILIREVETIPDNEVLDILKKLRERNIKHFKVVAFLLLTGLRCSEIIGLSFNNVDFRENVIRIPNYKEDREDKLPIHNALRQLLLSEWDTHEGQLFDYKSRHSLQFFKRFLKKEGYNRYSLHTLRKTFISKLLNSGFTVYDTKTLARHMDIRTTLKHYSNAEIRRMGEVINTRTNMGTFLGTKNKDSLKLIKSA